MSIGAKIAIAMVVLVAVVGTCFLLSQKKEVAAVVSLPPVAVHTVIGHSVEGRAIDVYSYGSGATHLLLVGGMHGGYEWNAVVLAYQMKAYLDAHPEVVPNTLTVDLIPSLNPDGVYRATHKEGAITVADISSDVDTVPGRFNAHEVDLNRNFDCSWQPEATWRSKKISAGTAAFSEPESQALRDFVQKEKPAAVVFWHSQSGNVYAASCGGTMAPHDLELMRAYASAAGYGAIESFDAYPVTGDSEGWLASIGIPAITVELTTHDDVEWDKNLSGIKALFDYFRVGSAEAS